MTTALLLELGGGWRRRTYAFVICPPTTSQAKRLHFGINCIPEEGDMYAMPAFSQRQTPLDTVTP